MMTLYGSGQSRSFRALWALEEAGLDFEYIEVTRELIDSDDYKALNPQSKIPTLVHDSLVLTESAAIVNYAGALSKLDLVPTDTAQKAEYDDICYFVMTDFEQSLWTMGKHRFALPEEQRVEAVIKTALWEFEKAHVVLQQRMAGRDFAVSDQFSMADVLLAQTLNWAQRFEMDVAPELLAYRDRQYAREACVTSLARLEPSS